jgi:hypothetical protein
MTMSFALERTKLAKYVLWSDPSGVGWSVPMVVHGPTGDGARSK